MTTNPSFVSPISLFNLEVSDIEHPDATDKCIASVISPMWSSVADYWIPKVRSGLDVIAETFNNPSFFHDFLPKVNGLEVVELGCGEGRHARLLAEQGAIVTGVDISSRMIEAASDLEMINPCGIKYHQCSFTKLNDFEDNSFDMAVSIMAFMSSPGFSLASKEAYRVLRPKGKLIFSVLHPCFWTHGSHWIKDDCGQNIGMLTTDYWHDSMYFESGRFIFAGNKESFQIPRVPYRLEQYVDGLCKAGFKIERIMEPRPTLRQLALAQDILAPLRMHVPIFLYAEATKYA